MTTAEPAAPRGLYVHFPLCLSVCPYCDFVVYGGRAARGPTNRIEHLVAALEMETCLRGNAARARFGSLTPLRSVYLGGGTPSLMGAGQVGRLLDAVDAAFGIGVGAELTIEVNPGADERGDLGGFRAAGVNRFSIGAQSFDAGELRRIGRRHSAADIVATAVEARRAGFDNLSLDLLYDVPGQSLESWRATLDAALALQPEHVSAYALTLDDPDAGGVTGVTGDHLPLRPGARRWRERARPDQDGDRAAAMYVLADDLLSGRGLGWYEVSNWAVPGRESRHNLGYWLGSAWEAVGPGAHAFDGARTRRWNAARLDAYLDALQPADAAQSPGLPPGAAETVDERVAAADRAILRLRTGLGLPGTAVRSTGMAATLAWADANGMVEVGPAGAARLSLRGRLLADELFVRLVGQQPA